MKWGVFKDSKHGEVVRSVDHLLRRRGGTGTVVWTFGPTALGVQPQKEFQCFRQSTPNTLLQDHAESYFAGNHVFCANVVGLPVENRVCVSQCALHCALESVRLPCVL